MFANWTSFLLPKRPPVRFRVTQHHARGDTPGCTSIPKSGLRHMADEPTSVTACVPRSLSHFPHPQPRKPHANYITRKVQQGDPKTGCKAHMTSVVGVVSDSGFPGRLHASRKLCRRQLSMTSQPTQWQWLRSKVCPCKPLTCYVPLSKMQHFPRKAFTLMEVRRRSFSWFVRSTKYGA